MEGSDVAERDVRIDAFAHGQGSFLLTVVGKPLQSNPGASILTTRTIRRVCRDTDSNVCKLLLVFE
jgi:hypothetical protein